MPQGIDVRASTPRLTLWGLLQDSLGSLLTTGTTSLRLYRLQESATPALDSYDFNDNTFKTTALTTEVLAMTHRLGNNGTVNTGIWTASVETLTGFTVGRVYLARIDNSGASPATQFRIFQFGNAEGDLTVTSARLDVDVKAINADTNADDRLALALTTSTGIDVNMGQVLPASPTADTTGIGLKRASAALPAHTLTPGIAGGVTVTKNAGPDVVNFAVDTGSSASQIVIPSGSLPSGHTNDDYNGSVLVIKDVSAGNRINIRFVSDYTASTRLLDLNQSLGFTPEVGVDVATLWVGTSADVLAELLKVTTGFSATTPNNLISYLRAEMSIGATVPSGVGTYDPTLHSLEALRNRFNLAMGTGFSTGTDSLEAIRDAIDSLVAPLIPGGATATSGIGFLSHCVSLVRDATDEPGSTPKYTDAKIIEYVQSALDQIVSVINTDTDHPILSRFDITVVPGTQDYLLPCSVGEVWRIALIDTTTNLPVWEEYPTNEYAFSARGFTIEGNVLRFQALRAYNNVLQVLYVGSSEATVHMGILTANATTTALTMPATATDGEIDNRPDAYRGYVIRVLANTGAGQERIISAHNSTTGVLTPRPAFTTAPLIGSKYEVVPQYTRLVKHVVALHAALDIVGNEANTTKRVEIERRLQHKMTALRNTLGKKVNRFGTRGPGVDTIDNQDLWPLIP